MVVSIFDLFSIGIGPSSSHTVGPMRAARRFVELLESHNILKITERIDVELFGSLAMTGIGHGTDKAILLGLAGYAPQDVPLNVVDRLPGDVKCSKQLTLLSGHSIQFDLDHNMIFHKGKRLPYHSNGLRFQAYGPGSKKLIKEVYFSVGGGFVVSLDETKVKEVEGHVTVPFPFRTFKELKEHCLKHHMRIDQVMMENEKTWHTEEEVKQRLLQIWAVMQESIQNGMKNEGVLPGGLDVHRRAFGLHQKLEESQDRDPLHVIDWASMVAIAVNEENAAGGRVVTAPTNGAAGVIPATLFYYRKFVPGYSEESVCRFLLTAGAITILYKFGASISAAEMGCQGEIGVASSMAAGALTAVMGGTLSQIENAAEIAMEHHLGTTCDPIGGLVQIPCIERNAMGVVKAINASRLALRGSGKYRVSLDEVIGSMREIGNDMHAKYKETSTGGLATNVPLNVPEC
ncbi:MAG: L-serine ammonia-lyase [Simkaniaceae bacterium]|nr:L-serine ammonia-lyase [Simkaniaceae bacterium]